MTRFNYLPIIKLMVSNDNYQLAKTFYSKSLQLYHSSPQHYHRAL